MSESLSFEKLGERGVQVADGFVVVGKVVVDVVLAERGFEAGLLVALEELLEPGRVGHAVAVGESVHLDYLTRPAARDLNRPGRPD